ncbi:hypothetical protein [uncultured Maribacter sp.]|uniref:hypothetical protein n=1 Tax=uncultured Maribacter sp. TaxID=431308 RepID=UPI00260BBF1C|nr:hypothetical protein [uncultured Maribacter sp.]
MLKIFLYCLFVFPVLVFNQFSTPKVFGEIGGFYEEQFEPSPNVYLKLSAGAELFSYKFLAPEIDISYYKGNDEDENSDFDNLGMVNYKSFLKRDASTVIWGFAPKLFYGDEEYRLVLIPKYSFGTIHATGNLIDSNSLEIEKKSKADIHFWSFAFGIEGYGWSDNTICGLYLIYTGFNAGKALNKLDFTAEDFSNENYNTKAIGLSFRIAYNFKKNK